MGVKFDSITPLPSGAAARRVAQRAIERRQRRERHTTQRREQLLDVAMGLFEEVGSQGFNMRQMAQRAGYTPGALYAYFRGKESILSALQLRVIDLLAEEVRAVSMPKQTRVPRAMALAPDERDAEAQTRALFIAQCMAWWRLLDRDPYRLQLLLKEAEPTETPLEPGTPKGDAPVSVLVRFGMAIGRCRDTLHARGLQGDAAQQLHDEVLAYGLGLLVLQRAGAPGADAGLETRFLQTLHRWLDRKCVDVSLPDPEAPGPQERQGDLFAG